MTIALNSAEQIEKHMTPYQILRRRKLLSIDSIIESTPNNPLKLCENLKIPVTIIEVDDVIGKGHSKSYLYNSKEFKKPELVAKAYYETLGYKATWSEGFAYQIIIESILSEVASRVKNNFTAASYPTPIPIIHTGDTSVVSKNAMHEYKVALRKSELKNDLAAGGLRAYKALKDAFGILLINDLATRENKLKNLTNIKIISNPESVRDILIETIKEVAREKPVENISRWFPILTDIADDDFNTKKNLTEWTLKFAEEILIEFDWAIFSEMILRSEGDSNCCFDLTLFHLLDKKIKFVEVKFEDKFTQAQLTDIILNMLNDVDIEVAIIRKRLS